MNAPKIALVKRITPMDLADYINRRLTSKDIANIYGVSSRHVTMVLPKRAYTNQKVYRAELRDNRKKFRESLALRVLQQTLTPSNAAAQAHCSMRTMYRHISKVKAKNAG